jgi:hypothetical protein
MNVILNTPIAVTLTTGNLVSEGDGSGTIEFQISGQQVFLALPTTDYVYDLSFGVGDRVKLTEAFAGMAINSSGIVQQIIIDAAGDKANVTYDNILPDINFNSTNKIYTNSGVVSVLIETPLNILVKV